MQAVLSCPAARRKALRSGSEREPVSTVWEATACAVLPQALRDVCLSGFGTPRRLPAAHTCFRQLDLPRYASREELRDKVVCAITTGQGYLALS